MSGSTFNRAVISQEIAVVYSGGGRRYFTLKAAARGAAKKYMRDLIAEQGEDGVPQLMFQREVGRMAGELLRGEAMTFDWDEANERAKGDDDEAGVAYHFDSVGREPGVFD